MKEDTTIQYIIFVITIIFLVLVIALDNTLWIRITSAIVAFLMVIAVGSLELNRHKKKKDGE